MGRIYSFPFAASDEAAQGTLMYLANAADRICLIHEWGISQLADVGDAEEEMLLIDVVRNATVTGGTGATEVQFDTGDAAPAATGSYNAAATTGGSIIQQINWNIRVPLQVIYTPETRPVLGISEKFAVELSTTPTDSITFAGYMIWEEIGT